MFSGGNKFSKGFIFGCLTFLVLAAFFISLPVFAQSNFGLDSIDSLPKVALIDAINRIIKIVLSLLGVIAVILILYGGFVWMTSGGDAKKVAKAKAIISNALIGLIIIFLSYAITSFILGKLQSATNSGGGGGGGGGGGVLPVGVFGIKGIETTYANPGAYHQNVYLCSNVQTKFNQWVSETSIDDADTSGTLKIIKVSNNLKVDGSWQILGGTLVFKHPAIFEENTAYQAVFPKSISNTSIPPKFLAACLASGGCVEQGTNFVWNFTTGQESDSVAPYVISTYPISDNAQNNYPDQNVSKLPVIDVDFSEAVDVTTIMQAGLPPHPISGNIKIERIDQQNGNVIETIDSNILEIEDKSKGFRLSLISPNLLDSFSWYRITAQNIADLCNNPMAAAKVWEFQTNDKAPGVSSWYPKGIKVCPDTAISITFNTTMYNNQVNISITGGGTTLSSSLPPAKDLAPPYSITNNSGTFSIKDPDDPVDNKFRVFEFIPADYLLADTDYEVKITTDFKISSFAFLTKEWNFHVTNLDSCVCSPYISKLDPGQGPKGQCLTILGHCFKGTKNESASPTEVKFDNSPALISSFDKNYITTTLPNNFNQGDKPESQVTITYDNPNLGSLESNLVEFYVNSNDEAKGPCLWSLNPNSGSQGKQVVIKGDRFGSGGTADDKVKFNFGIDAQTTSWDNENIKTIVPSGASDGNVVVINNQGTSNGLPFDVTGGVNQPCSSNPFVCLPDSNNCNQGLICNLFCNCQASGGPGTGVCGDTILQVPNSNGQNEQCDDGNTVPGDGCSFDCKIEGAGSSCDADPNIPACQLNNSICAALNPNLFCDFNSNCTCQVFTSQPEVEKTNPLANETNVCRNVLISVTFNKLMNAGSFKDNIILTEGINPVLGNISSFNQDSNNDGIVDQTVLLFSPKELLKSNSDYQVLVKGGLNGVKSNIGGTMINDYPWSFSTGATICKINKINITVEPPGQVTTSDLFQCAGKNDCSDDQDASASGNQHRYIAQALDKDNNPLSASYFWVEQQGTGTNLLGISSDSINNPLITAINKNGGTVLQVQAQSQSANNTPNAGIERVDVQIFTCENPWPSLTDFPYKDAETNFSTFYCRDGKILLSDFDSKVAIPGNGDLIKEFLFKESGEKDAIGIRVMKNPEKLDPLMWYQKYVPNPSNVTSITVNGYEAIKSGRTVYVNASNVVNNQVYANIYLISYNEGASTSTIDIFNQLVNNWRFNTNILDLAEKQKLIYDLVRWGDNNEIVSLLEKYKTKHGYYPKIESGSYINGISASKWPSWQLTLGKELGRTLPVDPVNEFGDCLVPPGYNPDTCWNEQTKQFAGTIPDDVPFGTNVYFYQSLNNGNGYILSQKSQFGNNCNSDQCEDGGNCYAIGSCHPTQSLSYCKMGSWQAVWKSSCGNGIVSCGEECDSNQQNYCDVVLGNHNWYNEPKFQGCLPPGDPNQCKWNPQQVYTAADCGGWCGDEQSNGPEQCDIGNQNGVACNPPYSNPPAHCTYCNFDCTNKTLVGAYCGDWIPNGPEQCDSGSNNGIVCSPPYNATCCATCNYCNNICKIIILNGAYCGDGTVNGPEQCEWPGNGTSPNDQWACSSCHWAGGWVGDGVINGPEQCDNGSQNGVVCTPPYSNPPASCTYCDSSGNIQTVQGGYCGNNDIESSEGCDNGSQNGVVCNPQYNSSCTYCNSSCQPVTLQGTNCGDDIVNGPEQCDDGPINGTACIPTVGSSCAYCGSSCQNQTAIYHWDLVSKDSGPTPLSEISVYCSSGETLVGGGCARIGGAGSILASTVPVTNGWYCRWGGGGNGVAQAICSTKPVNYNVRNSGIGQAPTISCNAGETLISGGCIYAAGFLGEASASYPNGNTWYCSWGGGTTGRARAICVSASFSLSVIESSLATNPTSACGPGDVLISGGCRWSAGGTSGQLSSSRYTSAGSNTWLCGWGGGADGFSRAVCGK